MRTSAPLALIISAIWIVFVSGACHALAWLVPEATSTAVSDTAKTSQTPVIPTKTMPSPSASVPPASPVPGIRGERPPLIPLPPVGMLYNAAYPGEPSGAEDDITLEDLQTFEEAAGKSLVWVYFSHNWYKSPEFPQRTADWIRQAGSIPYVRLMLRSDSEQYHADEDYSPIRILEGAWDDDLRAWMQAARNYHAPLIVEYGTEMNGEWFSWNGSWNGAGGTAAYGDAAIPDGPERFRDAYRRIIDLGRAEGAANLTWVFHVNAYDNPDEPWNRFESYYPGDDYIDWLGVSVYGAQTPLDEEWEPFRTAMDAAYLRLARLSPEKPIALLEFGATSRNPHMSQEQWAENALKDITAMRWKRLFALAWWNDAWQNDDDPAHDTDMRVQSNPLLAAVFQQYVGDNPLVLGKVYSGEEGQSSSQEDE